MFVCFASAFTNAAYFLYFLHIQNQINVQKEIVNIERILWVIKSNIAFEKRK